MRATRGGGGVFRRSGVGRQVAQDGKVQPGVARPLGDGTYHEDVSSCPIPCLLPTVPLSFIWEPKAGPGLGYAFAAHSVDKALGFFMCRWRTKYQQVTKKIGPAAANLRCEGMDRDVLEKLGECNYIG